MAPDGQPPDLRPPAHWGDVGPKGPEKIWPKTHLTMYALVSLLRAKVVVIRSIENAIGWMLGAIAGGLTR